jgi:hypothetical protein
MRRKRRRDKDNGDANHEDDTQQRIKACQRDIEVALAKHQCIIVPEVVIRGPAIDTSVRVLPRPG